MSRKKPEVSRATEVERLKAAIAGLIDDTTEGELEQMFIGFPEPTRSAANMGMAAVCDRLRQIVAGGES